MWVDRLCLCPHVILSENVLQILLLSDIDIYIRRCHIKVSKQSLKGEDQVI